MTYCALIALAAACCASACAATNERVQPHKQDLSWKRYVDKESGFCIAYPNRWIRQETSESAGLSFATGVKRFSMPIGEMDVIASTAEDPVRFVEAHLEGVKKFVRAQDVEVTDHHELTVSDNPALFTKDRYRDPLEKAEWVEELVLTRYKNVLYRMEMVCRADSIARFEPIFSRFVGSFQFECNAKR